jgi:hypothetical protein
MNIKDAISTYQFPPDSVATFMVPSIGITTMLDANDFRILMSYEVLSMANWVFSDAEHYKALKWDMS